MIGRVVEDVGERTSTVESAWRGRYEVADGQVGFGKQAVRF